MAERVNHPDYYNQGKDLGHIECIDLLELICEGYSGIGAFDLGQTKYLYRFGNKTEEGLKVSEKSKEDLDKGFFYLKDFQTRALKALKAPNPIPIDWLPLGFACCQTKSPLVAKLVANEFAFFKADTLKPLVIDYIESIFCMRTFGDLNKAIDAYKAIIREVTYQETGELIDFESIV